MNVAPLLERLPPSLRRILHEAAALAARRGEALYLVGGPVRDLLLERPVTDLDLSVVGDGVAVARALGRRLGGRRVTPSQFGTAKLRLDDAVVDVATARREEYQHPGALPTVAPGSILEDLTRRDFTINAQAVDLHPHRHGELLDPHGGQEDLKAGLVRVLHPNSFVDDATRMLRAVRYEQRLAFRLEPKTEALVRRHAAMLDTIGGDRLRHEVTRLLGEPDPARCLRRAWDLDLLTAIHPSLGNGEAAAQRVSQVAAESRETSALLAALAADMSPAEAEALIDRLRLPRREAEAVQDAASFQELYPLLAHGGLPPSQATRLLERRSPQALRAWALLEQGGPIADLLRRYLEEWHHLRPALDGNDLQALGVPPGPRLGRLLRELRDARLDGHVSSRDEEIAWVRGRVEG